MVDGSWVVDSKNRSSFCPPGESGHWVLGGVPYETASWAAKNGRRKEGHKPGLHLLFSRASTWQFALLVEEIESSA